MNQKIFLGTIAVSLLLVLGLWSFTRATTGEIFGCVGPSGILRILNSGSCKQNETPISWKAQGEKGEQGEPGEQGIPGENGKDGLDGKGGVDGKDGTDLHLFDGNNQDLGILTSEEFPRFWTFLPTENVVLRFVQNGNNHTASLDITNTGFVFTQPACAGTPYSSLESTYPNGILKTVNGFYRFTSDPAVNIDVQSSMNADGSCVANFSTVKATPVEQVTLPLSFPLAWPLQIKPAP